MTIVAPTGSGKTVLLEMAMLRTLIDDCDGGKYTGAKIIYMAPTKSLCSEKASDWEKKFGKLGISCKRLTRHRHNTVTLFCTFRWRIHG